MGHCAKLVINYKSDRAAGEATAAKIVALGSEAELVQCDAADTSAIAAMAEAGITRFGKIDILVNNAGGGIAKPADQLSDADYDFVFDVNVKAYVAAARAVLPQMKPLGWGRIICISSVAGRSGKAFIGTSPAYAGAKGAVISYSRSMARECGAFGMAATAAKQLLELHPDVGGFHLAPGAHASRELDIMSDAPGVVGAETFAAVDPRNNRKLFLDLQKMAARTERHRYVFFMSPLYPDAGRQATLERDGVEVWSLPF